MIKYFIPDAIAYDIQNKVEALKFNNNYNKTIFDFNSDDMDLDIQIKHSILKLQHSVENNIYSSEIAKLCDVLISSFEQKSNSCVYEFNERAETLFLNIVLEEYLYLQTWFATRKKISSVAMDINYKIKLESFKFIKKIDDDNINLQDLVSEYESYIKEFKPLTWLVKDLKNINLSKVHISIWTKNFEVNTNVKNIVFTEDSIIFEFGCGRYKIDNFEKVHPVELCDLIYGEHIWAYELDGFVTIWCEK